MTERIVVSSADDAWALLRAALDGKALPDRVSLVFDGWPRFQMKVSGRDWHGTVPTRIMAPLLDVQRDLYRAYANVCYGDSNLRRLRDEDRELLELVLKVDEGSSEYEAPLYEQLTELARKAIDKWTLAASSLPSSVSRSSSAASRSARPGSPSARRQGRPNKP